MTPYILLLEDNLIELKKIKETIENHLSVDVIPINNADNMMSLITKYAGRFSAFVLDIEMSGQAYSGIDLAQKIRQLPECTHTPIIFLSSHSHYSGGVLKNLHYYDFICKPYDPSLLIRSLENALALNIAASSAEDTSNTLLLDGPHFQYELRASTISCIELFRNEMIVTDLLGNDTRYIVKPKALPSICNQLEHINTSLSQVHRCYIINLNRIKKIEWSKNTALVYLFNVSKPVPVGKSFLHILSAYK